MRPAALPRPALGTLFTGCALLAGCTYRVTPPATVSNPAAIIVVDHGVHSSLVLPREQGDAAEYAYGQWDWFVLDRVARYRAIQTLLLPGKAGLGRQTLPGDATVANVKRWIPAENYYPLIVERERVDQLRDKLDAAFSAPPERTLNRRLGLEFVPDPEPYSLLHHCNTRIAAWLHTLGCKVSGLGPDATFEIAR